MIEGFDVRLAGTTADVELIREMFREYQAWLEVDLCFQDFVKELPQKAMI